MTLTRILKIDLGWGSPHLVEVDITGRECPGGCGHSFADVWHAGGEFHGTTVRRYRGVAPGGLISSEQPGNATGFYVRGCPTRRDDLYGELLALAIGIDSENKAAQL